MPIRGWMPPSACAVKNVGLCVCASLHRLQRELNIAMCVRTLLFLSVRVHKFASTVNICVEMPICVCVFMCAL